MNSSQKKALKRQKRKKIVQEKNAKKAQHKIEIRQRIKVIKADLKQRMENMVVLTPEQKAEYVSEAKKILKIPEETQISFEHIVQAMQIARRRHEIEEARLNGTLEGEKPELSTP